MPRIDYREVLTKTDILTMRRALAEAIFFYSAEGTPESVAPRRKQFEALLKKLNGQPIQRRLLWPTE